jgi:flavin reductase (DIM6/NTAB) family NADH-FMN oxidoreductase RutF
VSIHSEHPFAAPEGARDPARRLRGRLGGTVCLVTSGSGTARAGLTVSSAMVAHGEPAHLLVLLDPDSALADVLADTRRGVVQLLSWPHRDLAEAFAGLAPAPGGLFRMGTWSETAWGPRLDGVSAWAGFDVADISEVGWSLLVDGVLAEIHLDEEVDEPLVHRRGRYQRPRDAS